MGINQFFRQHFSQESGILGEVQEFSKPDAHLQFDNNLFGFTGNFHEVTFNVWLYPTSNDAGYIFRVSGSSDSDGEAEMLIHNGQIGLMTVHGQGISNFGTINLNQWNHIVMSQRAGTVVTSFGTSSGAVFDLASKRSYNSGTGYLNDFHLMINGTVFSRYIEPGTSGFFHNDFAIDDGIAAGGSATGVSTGIRATDGRYTNDNRASETLITSDNTTDTFIGIDGTGNTNQNAFKGHMFQWYVDDEYYDLRQTSNQNLFRDGSSGGSVSSLPANPLAFLTGGEHPITGHNTGGTFFNRGVMTSTLSKP